MTQTPEIHLPPELDSDEMLAQLDRVLDPELDESVLPAMGNSPKNYGLSGNVISGREPTLLQFRTAGTR